VLAAVAFACITPTAVLADYVAQGSFGSPGPGDGQVELVASNFELEVDIPGSGLAVNNTSHDVYVADTDNHRIAQFSPTGTFIRAFGADVGGAGVDVCTLSCVAGTPGTSPGAFESPTLIAIDNSPSGAGEVYVGDTGSDIVTKFEADGTLVSSWGTSGQLDGSEATSPPEPFAGPFTEIVGIAVDSAGNLNVLEVGPNALFRFARDSTFLTNFETPRGSSPAGLAIDQSGSFFKVNGAPSVEKFDVDGTDIAQVSASEGTAGFAVDSSTGELFILRTNGFIDRYAFEPSGEVAGTGCAPASFAGCPPTETISEGDLTSGAGIAVDGASHTVYAADPGVDEIIVFALVTTPNVLTEPATTVGAVSATLSGTVNPNGAPLTECFFEWGETTAYGEVAPCEDPNFEEVGEDSSPVAVHADIVNLKPGTTYHFRLAAANANNAPGEAVEGSDESLLTLGPTIQGETVSGVTSSGALISGEINPRGKATDFLVEVVTEAQFQETDFDDATAVPATPREAGNGTVFVKVNQQLSGLESQTTYRFRLVATNADATLEGTGGKFTTFAPPSTELPNGRKYEMVSPPQKTGEVIPPEPVGALGGSCSDCLPGQNKQIMPMQATADGEAVLYEGQPFFGGLAAGPNEYVSERSPEDWGDAESLSTPTTTGSFEAFSSDLSRSVLYQVDPPLSPEAPTRGGEPFPNFYLRSADGQLQPLITVEPPQREPGIPSQFDNRLRIRYAGANAGATLTPEFSHLIFEANDTLTEAVPGIAPAAPEVGAGDECTFVDCNLYDWSEGQLRLVNVLPKNTSAATDAVLGSGRLLTDSPQYEAPNVDHAISDDGSRIFWSEEGNGEVYVRVDSTKTLNIPGPGSCKGSVPANNRACFLTASADGSKILLSNGQIYELQESPEAYVQNGDLTEGKGGFEGILGASEDLARVYFIDTADLTGSEENANEEEAEGGELNLYAWDDGSITFIGVLFNTDNQLGVSARYGAWKAAKPNRTAQVSPDGRYLAFMSQARLTEYDNTVGNGGQCNIACREVYVYATDSKTLRCASCNPSGQRPIGRSNLSLLRPGVPPGSGYPPFPQPSNLSSVGEGRLFFESQDILSPQDTNGTIQDVYQWEPQGVGTCEQAQGCVSLISSGHSANDSMFLDSTPNGDDAFFITRERLLPRDEDEQLDLYDARVGGGFAESLPEICNPEACKGAVSSSPFRPSAASSGFVGPSNPSAKPVSCKRGFVKKQGKCVKKKPKKHKQGKHKRGGAK
jgi:hypothetical protein